MRVFGKGALGPTECHVSPEWPTTGNPGGRTRNNW
jgi:hypothetical protein